jgi:hypothetical protein
MTAFRAIGNEAAPKRYENENVFVTVTDALLGAPVIGQVTTEPTLTTTGAAAVVAVADALAALSRATIRTASRAAWVTDIDAL